MALKKTKGQVELGISKLLQESTHRLPEGTRRLPTLDILPDPAQPRKLLPSALYERLFSGEQSPTAVLTDWLAFVKTNKATQAHKQAVTDLAQLATTVAWRDLISPITLRSVTEDSYPAHVRYLIRTGERRWWAHVWLILHNQTVGESGESPETIRAIVEEGDANIRADQWIENQARTDLSVVENALGLEAVRAEMSRGQPRLVAWREVEERLGISNNYRLRVINVLKLSDEVVGLIAQNNLPERAVRPLVDKLASLPEYQLPALLKLVEWRANGEDNSNQRLTEYIERELLPRALPTAEVTMTQPERGGQKAQPVTFSQTEWVSKFGQSVGRVLRLVDSGMLDEQRLTEVGVVLANDQESLQAMVALRDRLNRLLAQVERG